MAFLNFWILLIFFGFLPESLKVESSMNCGDRLVAGSAAVAAWQARSAAVSAQPVKFLQIHKYTNTNTGWVQN